jgi:hypothetical protein
VATGHRFRMRNPLLKRQPELLELAVGAAELQEESCWGNGQKTKLFSANNLSETTPAPQENARRAHAKTGAQKTVGTDAQVTSQKVCDRIHWVLIPSKVSSVAV